MFDKDLHEKIIISKKLRMKELDEMKVGSYFVVAGKDEVIYDPTSIFGNIVNFTGEWFDDNQCGKNSSPVMVYNVCYEGKIYYIYQHFIKEVINE